MPAFSDWYDAASGAVLRRAIHSLQRYGALRKATPIHADLRKSLLDVDKPMKTQAVLYKIVLPHVVPFCAQEYLGKKILKRRWNFAFPVRIVADRWMRNIGAIKHCVPPCVLFAMASSILNGWATAGRFQRVSPCVFGCGRGSDRLEHYAVCSAWRGRSFRGIDTNQFDVSLASFLLVDQVISDQVELIQKAVMLYAVYYAFLAVSKGGSTADISRLVAAGIRVAGLHHQQLGLRIDRGWS